MPLLDNITVAFLTLVTLYVLTVARTVTKLVPSLTEVEQCDDIPQEVSETSSNVSCLHYTVQVCSKKRGKPRKVKYPSVKKWCYKTTTEVGGHNLTTASVTHSIYTCSQTASDV